MIYPVDPVIDYARPCMLAEIALKDMHNAALARDYDAAVVKGIEAMVEVRLSIQNLKLMKEQEDALRNKATSV
jgi:hypothetical protein